MQCMYYDGKTRRGPVELPSHAIKTLIGGMEISNPRAATEAQINACGYYRVRLATVTPGMVISARSWPDTPNASGVFVERIDEQIPEADYAARLEAERKAQVQAEAELQLAETAMLRAILVEDYADYEAERKAINTLADKVLGVGIGPQLVIETLAEYAERRTARYKLSNDASVITP